MTVRREFRQHLQNGLTLVELMIAMVLGLIVIGAAGGIFLSNQRASQTTTAMGGLQDAAVIGFEMLGRDIREAGGNPCDAELVNAPIISGGSAATPSGATWYLAWGVPLYGYEGSSPAGLSHQSGTDVLQILRAGDDVRTLTADMASGASSLAFSPAQPLFSDRQSLMVCDGEVLSVFGAAGASSAAGSVGFGTAGGNACAYFPRPNAGACGGSASTDAYLFKKFSQVASVHAVRWFTRTAGTTMALYRQVGSASAEEVVRGVGDFQVWYLHEGAYKTADLITNADAWNDVSSVRIRLTVAEEGSSGVDGGDTQLRRPLEYVFAVRNRLH